MTLSTARFAPLNGRGRFDPVGSWPQAMRIRGRFDPVEVWPRAMKNLAVRP
jgi:hypothetical protein